MAQNKIVITPDTTTVTVSSVGLNGPAGADGSVTFPYTGSAIISGSLDITGSLNVTGTTSGSFIGDGSGLIGVPLGDVFPYTGSALITGSLDITGSITGPDYIDFAIGVDTPYGEGRLFYDKANGALAFYNDEADITLQIGQEFYRRVTNKSGNLITNGTPVYIDGSQGQLPTIAPAISRNIYTSSYIPNLNGLIGLATHDIPDNGTGYVTEQGVVNGIDTRDFSAGDNLYLQTGSSTFRNTPPPFPYDVIGVGVVTRSQVNGSISVTPSKPFLSGNISGIVNIELEVQSCEDITIPKGTPVHLAEAGTGPISLVKIAKANDPSLMPATYVTENEITSGSRGTALAIGYLYNIDTSGSNVGDTLYVSNLGGFTTSKPTGSSFIQNMGVVVQSSTTEGSAFIYGSGRSNDLPNIQEGYTWVGNSDGVATAVPTAIPTYIDTEISSAQLLDIHNTPVITLPKPINGDIYIVDKVFLKYSFGTTAYSQLGVTNIVFTYSYYNNGVRGNDVSNSLFFSSISDFTFLREGADGISPPIGGGDISISTSNPITLGDGTMKIRTYYSVIPSTF